MQDTPATMMAATIDKKLRAGLAVQKLDIINESHMHSGPATDSHFKLIVVSENFTAKRPVARHQLVYGLLADELAGPVHALALHLYTPEEWLAESNVPASPTCRGAK